MDFPTLIFIILSIVVIFGLKPLRKARKKAYMIEVLKFNRLRASADNPREELSKSTTEWIASLIGLIEISAVIGLIYVMVTNETIRQRVSPFLVIPLPILWIINLWLKRFSYDKGLWLSKYSRTRALFFLPIIGGYFLTRVEIR